MSVYNISATITGLKYSPLLCRELNKYEISNLKEALQKDASFILRVNNENIYVSWWVSPKRTRSYPYGRVYDTLQFQGKKITIIPIIKDEGLDGDRDFLQWDTISLMSLLGVNTIIAYYSDAERNTKYSNKITNQRFNIDYIIKEINNLLIYKSDALHWNLSHLDKIGDIANKALNYYTDLSRTMNVKMHSKDSAEKRIKELFKGKDHFMDFSRNLAQQAQTRESLTVQPKEYLTTGAKAKLSIKNYLGGYYYMTSDEAIIDNDIIYLVEGKHSKQGLLPSLEDIKDGLMKMILFTNLKEVKIGNKEYKHVSVLKLTNHMGFSKNLLRDSQLKQLYLLKEEADKNCFEVWINDKNIKQLI